MRLLATLLSFLILLVVFAGYWLFYDNRMPEAAQLFTIGELRQSALSIEGPMASRIDVETMSDTPTPKVAIVAGTTWSEFPMVRNSYQLVFPDSSIVIDSGHSREDAIGARTYDDAAWSHVLDALAEADTILLTHGHGDHSGGLAASLDSNNVQQAAMVSAAQIETMRQRGLNTAGLEPRLKNDGLMALAPGVVLIPAPGHTPGSQMIYVQTTGGDEFVFMGDTASHADNIRRGKIRSRYVTQYIGQDDREAVFHLTASLMALSMEAPEVHLVPGHDGDETVRLVKRGLMTQGFR